MKHLATFWQYQFDKDAPVLTEAQIPITRITTKIVLFNEQGEVALTHYKPNAEFPHDEYYLPGGGVEEGETLEEGLRREVREEVGCEIKNIKELGEIIEYFTVEPRKNAIACYQAEVDGPVGERQLTASEAERGQGLAWLPQEIAIEKVKGNRPFMSRERVLLLLNLASNK